MDRSRPVSSMTVRQYDTVAHSLLDHTRTHTAQRICPPPPLSAAVRHTTPPQADMLLVATQLQPPPLHSSSSSIVRSVHVSCASSISSHLSSTSHLLVHHARVVVLRRCRLSALLTMEPCVRWSAASIRPAGLHPSHCQRLVVSSLGQQHRVLQPGDEQRPTH